MVNSRKLVVARDLSAHAPVSMTHAGLGPQGERWSNATPATPASSPQPVNETELAPAANAHSNLASGNVGQRTGLEPPAH